MRATQQASREGGRSKAAPYTSKLAYQPGPRAEALLNRLIGSPYQKRRDQALSLLVRAGNYCLKSAYTDGRITYSQLVSLRPGGDVRTVGRHVEALLFCGALMPVEALQEETFDIAYFLDCNRSVAERDAFAADMRAYDEERRRKKAEAAAASTNGMLTSSCPSNEDSNPRNDSDFERSTEQPTSHIGAADAHRAVPPADPRSFSPKHGEKIHQSSDGKSKLGASYPAPTQVDSNRTTTNPSDDKPMLRNTRAEAQTTQRVRLRTLSAELGKIDERIAGLTSELARAKNDDEVARVACAKRREEFRREKVADEFRSLQNGRFCGGVKTVEEVNRAADEALEDILEFERAAARHTGAGAASAGGGEKTPKGTGEGLAAAQQAKAEKRAPRKCVLAYIPREDSTPVNLHLVEQAFAKFDLDPGEWGNVEGFFSYLGKLEVRAVELEYAVHCMVTARMRKTQIFNPLAYCVGMILRQREAWESATPEERAAVAARARRSSSTAARGFG